MKLVKEILPRAVSIILIFTVLCGIVYTLLVTGIAQLLFPNEANGSIIEINGKKYGSELLAQKYSDDKHMWGRVMQIDTETFKNSNGEKMMYAKPSNISPASEKYNKIIQERIQKVRQSHLEKADKPIPVDLVTVSGSGLDPHISIAAAEYQIERLVKTTGKTSDEIQAIIDHNTQKRFLGLLGEPTVNVLKVNLALDGLLK